MGTGRGATPASVLVGDSSNIIIIMCVTWKVL